jgi:Transposase DDE domain
MLHSIGRTAVAQVQSLLCGFLQDGAVPFGSVLTVHDIVDRISQTCVETCDRIFTPVVTLCTFLSQIHSDDPSCRAAVARLNATRVAQGLESCSPRTGGYCKARQRLAESLFDGLMHQSGQRLQQQVPPAWHWHGRAVKIVDGSGVSMPDTEANQEAYPQPGSQKPGLGFPVARLVVVFSLACGAVLAAAVGRIKGQQSSEPMLFHRLYASLERGDVVLADRFYCSYWEVALLQGQGIDIVMRLHQRRQVDFREGRRVGREDHVVSWSKPKRPAWMDEATYVGLPATMNIRVLRVCVPQRGFRTRVVLVATTLLDAQMYSKEDLAGLYRARWHAELDLRSIKQTMQMDVLRCKTPAMVRKEIWGHLLVYNLLRAAMAQAALAHGVVPRQVSLQGTRQTLAAFHSLLAQRLSTARESVVSIVLSAIASHRVGTRPDRYEPRACKRRPKPYPLLRVPRQQARVRLATAA